MYNPVGQDELGGLSSRQYTHVSGECRRARHAVPEVPGNRWRNFPVLGRGGEATADVGQDVAGPCQSPPLFGGSLVRPR